MSIAELKIVMPPPAIEHPSDTGRWLEVERKFGVELPQDYKNFIDSYGGGKIAEFISIFSPFSENININIINQLNRQSDVLLELASSGEALPYPVFPANGGIFPVGMTDNGDVIYWRTGEARWGVVVNEARGPEWEAYDLSIVDFLVELLSGRVICGIFPKLSLTLPIKFIPSK